MDKTDMSLILLLIQNSRLSYAELADKLNLSINAVHKRIQQLIETDVIHKFTAKVSIPTSQAILVYIFGTSQLASFHDLPEKLRSNGSIYWLAIGSGKFIYTGAFIRNLSELEPLISFIKKQAELTEPTVGISQPIPMPGGLKPTDLALCDLDYRVISSLRDNSRKAIADVATELGVSAKTVRRRLNRMIKNNLIELTMEWYPDKSDDITTLMDLKLKPGSNLAAVGFQIQKNYGSNALFFWCYANIPDALTFVIWTNNMGELHRLREKIEREPDVISAVPYVLTTGYIFETWRDKLAQTMLSNSSTQ
jgi:Lrp/AsnC family leucine-responsive transcriptional regulator